MPSSSVRVPGDFDSDSGLQKNLSSKPVAPQNAANKGQYIILNKVITGISDQHLLGIEAAT